MIGAKITTTGVLLRKADTKATGGSIRNCALKTVVFPSGNNFFISCPNAPLWRIPSLTRKSIPTVIIPLLLKPSSMIGALIWDGLRPGMVLLTVVVLFLCVGILTPKEMLEGFSNKGIILLTDQKFQQTEQTARQSGLTMNHGL